MEYRECCTNSVLPACERCNHRDGVILSLYWAQIFKGSYSCFHSDFSYGQSIKVSSNYQTPPEHHTYHTIGCINADFCDSPIKAQFCSILLDLPKKENLTFHTFTFCRQSSHQICKIWLEAQGQRVAAQPSGCALSGPHR